MLSVFDKATGAYMRPWTAQSKGQAIRMFTDLVMDPQTDIAKHPEDYSLFYLGSFDDNEGIIDQPEDLECIARAHELKAQEQEKALSSIENSIGDHH